MEQSAPAIYPALAAIMNEIPAIAKDSQNTQQGFKYRGIDSVYNALNPIMAKHGVFMAPEVQEQSREERTNKNGTVLAFVTLRMKYSFYAQDGSSVSCVVCGEGMDSGDKATNKAMSIAQKYALFQVFCIPTKETADPDAESHEIKPKAAARRQAAPENAGASTDRQIKALYAAINKTSLPEYFDENGKLLRAKLLDVMSHIFGRPIESSKDLRTGEISQLINDPMLLRECAPAEPTDDDPITMPTLDAIEARLKALGAPGRLPPHLEERYDTGDPSELSEVQGQDALKELKGIK